MSFVFHKPYPVAEDSELAAIPQHLTRDPNKIYKARPSAVEAIKKMCREAESESIQIVAISSHRTLEFQSNYFLEAEKRHGKGKGALWVAPGGYSEHHTGYVFDLADKNRPETDDEPSFESTQTFVWLKHNAHRYGFVLSYPPGNWQGVSYEPWHWRFEGDDVSRSLFRPSLINKTSIVLKSMLKAFGFISAFIFLSLAFAHAEKVTFPAADGIVLEGDFLKPAVGKPTVVLLHGYMSNRPEWEPFAKYCHSKGIGAFYFDLRGHGKSQGSPQDFTKMVSDLGYAVKFLSSKLHIPPAKIGVGGASVGANVAFRYAANNPEVPFVFLLSPGLNYQGLAADDLMGPYGKRPLLLAASSGDRYAFYSIEVLERLRTDKSGLAVFREPPQGGHGVQMFRRAQEGVPSKLEIQIEKWIEKSK